MWLSSASRFSAPVKQQGFKRPFNQRCPLLCEASNSLPAQSLRDKHRIINAVGGHTFTKANTKKHTFTLFVFKLAQTRLSWFVRRRSKLCRQVECLSKEKSRLDVDQDETEVLMCRTWRKSFNDSITWFYSWCQRILRWWACALREDLYNQKNQNVVS